MLNFRIPHVTQSILEVKGPSIGMAVTQHNYNKVSGELFQMEFCKRVNCNGIGRLISLLTLSLIEEFDPLDPFQRPCVARDTGYTL